MVAVRASGTVTNDYQHAYIKIETLRGKTPTELVEALRYKSEGRGFDSRWCH